MTIFIGKDEKEVQNLGLRTTVNEVIAAVVREDEEPPTHPAYASQLDLRNWVIVESWRGIERPLPPKTRLLKGKL